MRRKPAAFGPLKLYWGHVAVSVRVGPIFKSLGSMEVIKLPLSRGEQFLLYQE